MLERCWVRTMTAISERLAFALDDLGYSLQSSAVHHRFAAVDVTLASRRVEIKVSSSHDEERDGNPGGVSVSWRLVERTSDQWLGFVPAAFALRLDDEQAPRLHADDLARVVVPELERVLRSRRAADVEADVLAAGQRLVDAYRRSRSGGDGR